MTPLGLAWRSLSREPVHAALGVCGVAAVGALLFNMLLLSRGLLVSFKDLLDSVGFDVRVMASESLPTLGPPVEHATEAARAIRALPEVEEVVPMRIGRAFTASAGRPEIAIILVGCEPRGRGAWRIMSGRNLSRGQKDGGGLPPVEARAPEIVVSKNLAKALGLEPGSRLRLRAAVDGGASAIPAVEFRVMGIGEFAFESTEEATAVTTLSALRLARGGTDEDEADLILVASRKKHGAAAAVAAIQGLRPDLHAFSNEQLVSRFSRTDFSYFRQISFVLSSITLFFAFLLVATLLTVSVNQRFGEVAALRALGFSRRRIVTDLFCESLLLVGAGGILSLPIGAVLARWLDTILRTMPGLPVRLHFFVFEPRVFMLHATLLAFTGLLAAAYPVYLAARLPIAATLRQEVVS
ncbi:MAG: hypothetical protein DMF49_08095 [Acidobacteria bacterium]|nr:MAG: hypothetical protein DMF49_08095 [Acidobacteriota bacterium]